MKKVINCLFLILFITNVLGQDILTLKKGAIYKGEFVGVNSGKVHFFPTSVSNFKPLPLNKIKELTQSDRMLIQDGRWMVDLSEFIIKNELIPYSLQKETHLIKNPQKFLTKLTPQQVIIGGCIGGWIGARVLWKYMVENWPG